MTGKLPLFGLVACLTAGLGGCDNMQHQAAGPDQARGADARASVPLPPPHAVARDFVEAEGNGIAPGQVVRPIDLATLQRGREMHEVFCAPCHGSDGYGRGIVVRRGFPAPLSYHDDGVRALSDTGIYAAIADGTGRMLPLADRMTPDDRWAVVAYVRALQFSQHAPVAELSAADRAHLEGSP